jgi:ABC-type transporter Mla subunit MlaD
MESSPTSNSEHLTGNPNQVKNSLKNLNDLINSTNTSICDLKKAIKELQQIISSIYGDKITYSVDFS